jgi:beta-phosphoglucomutase-like phosphatase (HAD superfamily)
LVEFLDFVERKRLLTAVATSSDADYAEFSLQHAGLDGRFRIIVTGDRVARGKPAPDIYLEAARQLRVEPSQCVALEDSEAGISAAAEAGMVTMLIPDVAPLSAIAVGAASYVFESLHEAYQQLAALVEGEKTAR